jgi:hypothetical protein
MLPAVKQKPWVRCNVEWRLGQPVMIEIHTTFLANPVPWGSLDFGVFRALLIVLKLLLLILLLWSQIKIKSKSKSKKETKMSCVWTVLGVFLPHL